MSFASRAMFGGAAIASLLGAGCREHVTAGLVLVFRSELAVPADLDDIEVQATHRERGEELRFNVPLGGPEGFFLPASHSINPSQSKRQGPYTFRIVGKLKGKAKTVYDFVADVPRDRVGTVNVSLQFLCYDQTRVLPDGQTVGLCPQGQTCIAGECKPILVYDGQSLPSYDPRELGLDPSATCYDAVACFASPTFLLPDLATCRVARPASGNFTVGLLLPFTKPGLPYFGRKLVVFDADGLAGYSLAGNEIQLPMGICNVMRNDPNVLLLASTTCTSKKERDPICRVGTDAGVHLVSDAELPWSVDSSADASAIDQVADGVVAEASAADSLPDAVLSDDGRGCVPGNRQCAADRRTVQVCSAAGQYVDDVKCSSICAEGVCAGICTPASTECLGATLRACNEQGEWVTLETCQFDCSPSGCLDECEAGTRRCNGKIPQFCTALGTWQSEEACSFSCALGVCKNDNVTCWGSNTHGQATAPRGVFSAVSAGENHTCGLRPDGSVECWGDNAQGQATPKSGAFLSVSAGGNHACGVRPDGSVECWGDNAQGQATPKSGAFLSVSAGGSHTCGVRTNGTIECWGLNRWGQAASQPGTYASVSAGWTHTCAIAADAQVTCWGYNDWGKASPEPGTFLLVSAGRSHTCGIRTDRTVDCWGAEAAVDAGAQLGSLASVGAGNQFSCGILVDGKGSCWGTDVDGRTAAQSGPLSTISVGGSHVCAILRSQ